MLSIDLINDGADGVLVVTEKIWQFSTECLKTKRKSKKNDVNKGGKERIIVTSGRILTFCTVQH